VVSTARTQNQQFLSYETKNKQITLSWVYAVVFWEYYTSCLLPLFLDVFLCNQCRMFHIPVQHREWMSVKLLIWRCTCILYESQILSIFTFHCPSELPVFCFFCPVINHWVNILPSNGIILLVRLEVFFCLIILVCFFPPWLVNIWWRTTWEPTHVGQMEVSFRLVQASHFFV
jgi:hypothetical protein